ncbi:hypothetical protein [Neisseria sp. 83E34]|uniref:hypothetical protein n=1 Tax=Neisseria sp. 83E34 TaxID=1692264 RepID=UPI0006CE86BA|nr:hypothetical protein [Neisseria sp. 83E34]KPN72673.1 hypothetical protein AKG09_02285 [Neisseria sp. 83E34]
MKQLKTLVPAILMVTALGACSTFSKKEAPKAAPAPAAEAAAPQTPAAEQPKTVTVDSIDGKKEVVYKCGDKGQNKLNVMYGFKGNDVVVAQVKYQDKLSPNLLRVVDDNEQNRFFGNGVVWSSGKADATNVDKVDGNMLTQEAVEVVNGQPTQVSQIVTKYCVLDKAETAKLNKAEAPAKGKKPAKKGKK